MIAVELRTPTGDRAYETVASIRIQDGHAEFTGRRELFALDVAVLDEHAGERVRYQDDPERWARNLRTAYRTGQLVPVITADSDPNPPPRRSRRPDITIPVREAAL
jgi:hypothetical protein